MYPRQQLQSVCQVIEIEPQLHIDLRLQIMYGLTTALDLIADQSNISKALSKGRHP